MYEFNFRGTVYIEINIDIPYFQDRLCFILNFQDRLCFILNKKQNDKLHIL